MLRDWGNWFPTLVFASKHRVGMHGERGWNAREERSWAPTLVLAYKHRVGVNGPNFHWDER